MEWFSKIFRTNTFVQNESNFMGSGCIFTNETHVLAGFQPNKKTPMLNIIERETKGMTNNPSIPFLKIVFLYFIIA